MPDGFLAEQPKLEATPEQEASPELSPLEADERAHERLQEEGDDILVDADAAPSGAVPPAVAVPSEAPAQRKDEVTIEVQEIMQDGLGDTFRSMSPEDKERFRVKGEEVAGEIAVMVRELKVEAKRVILLIRDWLLTIPGVNKFFLEQEAKIKTDRILELERERRETPAA